VPADVDPAPAAAPAPPEPDSRAPFHRVLLALDPAAHSPRLPVVLRELMDRWRPDLEVVHVVFGSTSVAANAADGTPANPEEVKLVQGLRADLVRWLGSRGESIPIRVLHGDPGERICEFAAYSDCDLVVLEGRPRTGLAGRLKGSVRRYVVANSDRSVLVIGV
jgi:nucleotide-binding universal stress UspA family protein